jgi:hypothetical protein
MAERIIPSNESPQGYAFDERVICGGASAPTADATFVAFVAPAGFYGTIKTFSGHIGTNVEDGTDAAQMAWACAINGVSIFTTAPVITKAAGTGAKNTLAAGTGITVAVLDTTKVAIVPGDIVTVTQDITRTTPETEYANVGFSLKIRPTAGTTIAT